MATDTDVLLAYQPRVERLKKIRSIFSEEGFISLYNDFFLKSQYYSRRGKIKLKNDALNNNPENRKHVMILKGQNIFSYINFLFKITSDYKEEKAYYFQQGIIFAEIMYILLIYNITPHNIINYYYNYYSGQKPNVNAELFKSNKFNVASQFFYEIQEVPINSININMHYLFL